MSLTLDGENDLPQWDSCTEFLDQPLAGLDIGTANWLVTGHLSDSTASKEGMHNAMSSLYGQPALSTSPSSPDKTSEYSPSSPVAPVQKTDSQKRRKKSKVAPKLILAMPSSLYK